MARLTMALSLAALTAASSCATILADTCARLVGSSRITQQNTSRSRCRHASMVRVSKAVDTDVGHTPLDERYPPFAV